MARLMPLGEAAEQLVHDGDAVAMEGFSHLVPYAAGHEVIRQRRSDLTLYRLAPDILYDQLIGVGCARKLVFSWAGNPSVGLLHRLRDAVEHDAPPLEIEEHSHAGLVTALAAGAANLPFGVLRGYAGTELEAHCPGLAWVDCPFTGERLAAVRAVRPDVGIIHAQQADRSGNVQLWGVVGVQKEVALASRRTLVTVEEIVDRLEPRAGAVTIPSWTIDAVALAPAGAYPSYALDYYDRDDEFYAAWVAISRDRERFLSWMDEHVFGGVAA
jgi:glutaconate CoA-transferase subunit A